MSGGLFANPYIVALPRGVRVALKSPGSLAILNCTWPVAESLMTANGDDEALRSGLQSGDTECVDGYIAKARALDILLTRDELEEAQAFHGPWTWGPITRMLMFGYQTDSFASADSHPEAASELAASTPLLPEDDGPLMALPEPEPDGLGEVMQSRRSRRVFGTEPISMKALASCLHAGFGITGERTVDGQRLPLTAAPSSGGLNTYDALVVSRNVAELESGTYRFVPQHQQLARGEGQPVALDYLFGGQEWAAEAACAVILMADLRRQARKYVFPTTISAVLIEAGARVELMLLRAEQLSMSGVVVGMAGVGAFDVNLAADAGIWGPTSMTVPVCAVLLGRSGYTTNKP